MVIQDQVWVLTLTVIAAIAVAFIYVAVQAGRPADAAQVQRRSHAIRRWWFAALVVAGVGVAYASLRPFPIVNQRGQASAAQVINATGRQWSWELSQHQVRAGTPVEFNVTSVDVNHGFAIYGPNERIVTQTQAMPGFTNRLLYTFEEPGKYRVMCLEYCGVAHHGMVTEFEVVVADEGAQP